MLTTAVQGSPNPAYAMKLVEHLREQPLLLLSADVPIPNGNRPKPLVFGFGLAQLGQERQGVYTRRISEQDQEALTQRRARKEVSEREMVVLGKSIGLLEQAIDVVRWDSHQRSDGLIPDIELHDQSEWAPSKIPS